MPFLRSATVRTSTAYTSTLHVGRVRTVTLAVACAAVLSAVAPSPAQAELAQAELGPTPQIVDDALPARALPPAFAPDAATFCPRPTGRWWEDVSALSCVELLAGRDHTTPMTERELAWLNFGGLPAYATVDVGAIDAAIAAFTQRLAEEAAAEEARLAAEAAAAAQARTRTRRPTRPASTRRTFSDAELIDISAGCGHDMGSAPTPEQDACIRAALEQPAGTGTPPSDTEPEPSVDRESARYQACLDLVPRPPDSAPLLGPERSNYRRAVAECVDREFPGYLARWEQEQAEWDAWLEEARRNDAAAQARLDARVEAAKAEAAATCPGAWTVRAFGFMVRSRDEVEVTIICQ